tara:strand:+ start:542 stop:1564 length:1023 start_codon:yes stop_codon:yes gene_type:complete
MFKNGIPKIIAEAGINHNGDIKNAFKLIDVAEKSGADFVKFQTFIPNNLSTNYATTVTYQKNRTKENYQKSLLEKNNLKFSDSKKLYNYTKKKSIKILSSPFDNESLEFLLSLKLEYIKIPSGEITNYFLLKTLSENKSKVILSTGMSSYKEISVALNLLISKKINLDDIIILHCISNYPTKNKDVNLQNMVYLKNKFRTQVGFSDHTVGSKAAEIAVALGANFIEKHITLDKRMKGPDHKISLNPIQFNLFVKKLQNTRVLLGSKQRVLTVLENENKLKSRKSLVAKKIIKKNDIFSFKNLTAKRPGTGISPMKIKNIIGKKSKSEYKKDQLISSNEEK